jgi:hypothetical protein
MNTAELLKTHAKAYEEIKVDYRDNIIPKLDENKKRKKEMRQELSFIRLMGKTKASEMTAENKEKLKALARIYGHEFSEGITSPKEEPEEKKVEETPQEETAEEEPAEEDVKVEE